VSPVALIMQVVALAVCGLTLLAPRRRAVRQAASALVAFGAGWLSLFIVASGHDPAWMVASGALCVGVSLATAFAALAPGPGEDPSGGDGGFGHGPQDPPGGPTGPGLHPSDPDWWPQFERDLADYVEACEAARVPLRVKNEQRTYLAPRRVQRMTTGKETLSYRERGG
jgi:hypothetical protein